VTDYSPFGVALDGRTMQGDGYRYGFQGQEMDDEISSEGNSYTAEFWQYSPRIARRWNIDPVIKVHESPYATFANNPILFNDPNGADTFNVVSSKLNSKGENLEYNEDGSLKKGQERMFLFSVYTKDNQKKDMTSRDFLNKYQMIYNDRFPVSSFSSTVNGKSKGIRTYAEFLFANSNELLLKKAMFVTSLSDFNIILSKVRSSFPNGLNTFQKIAYFYHGKTYDYKETVAKGYPITYVKGIGMFESDHLGNILYGNVVGNLTDAIHDGDFLQDGGIDDPYDSYSLALGYTAYLKLTKDDMIRVFAFKKTVITIGELKTFKTVINYINHNSKHIQREVNYSILGD
jgi:RHS repeat-associated protein